MSKKVEKYFLAGAVCVAGVAAGAAVAHVFPVALPTIKIATVTAASKILNS